MAADHTQADVPLPATGRGVLGQFLAALYHGYQNLPPQAFATGLTQPAAALRLGVTALRDLQSLREAVPRPFQVAVMGPTQVGKSTVVNLLLGRRVAEVSPLAGFTIHPQGFSLGPTDADLTWLEAFFPGWERRTPGELTRDRLDCFSLDSLPADQGIGSGTVVWDTPDFDSLKAQSYQQGVLEVATLADLIVLVLSREKYADLSVWNILQLLQPLQRPLLICLNKVTEDAREPMLQALRKHLAERDYPAVDIIAIPQQAGIDELSDANQPAGVEQLRESLRHSLAGVDRGTRTCGTRQLLQTHWAEWTAPLAAELDAARAWQQAIVTASEQALAGYKSEFLDHPQRFDTFRRAILELLQLLELPGLAHSLTRVRHVLTWPARKLFNTRSMRTIGGRLSGKTVRDLPGEEVVLGDLLEQLLTSLARDTLRRCEPGAPAAAFWQALSQRLIERHADLNRKFAAAAHRHYLAFQPEVVAAAHELYATLQEKPARLNALRAARATTDAAAIALALKTGGIGLNDLLFAPVMVSLTSMLTEGALGSYMTHVANRLKQRQYHAVEQQVFDGAVQPLLRELTDRLAAPGLFGIPEAEFQAARQALEAWTRA